MLSWLAEGPELCEKKFLGTLRSRLSKMERVLCEKDGGVLLYRLQVEWEMVLFVLGGFRSVGNSLCYQELLTKIQSRRMLTGCMQLAERNPL